VQTSQAHTPLFLGKVSFVGSDMLKHYRCQVINMPGGSVGVEPNLRISDEYFIMALLCFPEH